MKLLTLPQVGRRLGLSLPTVRKLLAEGYMAVVTPSPGGRSRRVREEDLAAFIQSRLHRVGEPVAQDNGGTAA